MNHQDDNDIIAQVLTGNTQVYGVLVHKYERYVFTLCLRMVKNNEEAEEVAQDVFVKAYQKLRTFRQESRFSTWIYRIAYNRCLDYLAAAKRKINVDNIERIKDHQLSHTEHALDLLHKKERSMHLKKCLDKLPEDEAFLITVYYFEEKSVSEVAAITGLGESNVKVKLYRGRKRLFNLLNAELFHEKKEVS
ncbi:MAG: RNA polymerase [Cytophagaceae bacterium]|nr:RNA polymerase [Cytophagaceae bacterium]|tara:strand:- start:13051 stop:13626 length:576 start_codon:yes stop_codon:yes gene_type:complete